MEKTKAQRPTLSQNIAKRRKALGMNQLDLAEKAGVGISTLKDIERGLSSGQPATRAAIAEVLGCTVDELFAPTPAVTPTEASLIEALRLMKERLDKMTANPLVALSEKVSPERAAALAEFLEQNVLNESQTSDKSDKLGRRKNR